MVPSNSSAGNPVCSSASIAGCPLPDHGNELPTHLPTKRRLISEEEGARETPPKLRRKASSQTNSKLPNKVSTSIGEGKAPSKQGSDNQHRAKKKKPGLKKTELPLQLHDQTAGKETDLSTASGEKKSYSTTPVQIVEALPAFKPPPVSRTVTRSASANLPHPVSQPVTKSTSRCAAATTKQPPTNGPMTVAASGNIPPMLPTSTQIPSATEDIRGENRAEDQKQVMSKWPLILEELIELGKECELVGEAILREGLNVRGAAAMHVLVQQWRELKLAESASLLKRAELSTSVVKVALNAFRATS